jgi:amino acid transporter
MEHSETQPLLEAEQCNPRADPPAGYPDSLPGANHGKSLSWASAYILVVSRVVGSGIFATPGSIVKSTGSIGLSLLVWLVGTILAACGMAVSMEFGCMLPRSGGDKVDP